MMSQQQQQPWSLPVSVAELPAEGQSITVEADADVRARLAALAGLRSVDALTAALVLQPHGTDGVRVSGRVSATVGQTCVVTLEPIDNAIEEDIDVTFSSHSAPVSDDDLEADPPDLLVGGAVDIGAVVTEFFILGLDPYPRKPGVEFEPLAQVDGAAHPFAALARLKGRKADG